jgi:hypothetical protein
MDNLEIYNRVRAVPDSAKKTIAAGRLKGMTDINPMWRIKKLTEEFGLCGIGWYPEIVRTWIDDGAAGERTTNVEIKLYVKYDNEWSKGIAGIGGAKFISKENSGLYTDDECYKKAYTDALSVACKALGIGADVYYERDETKYAIKQNKPKIDINGEKLDKTISKSSGKQTSETTDLQATKTEESAKISLQRQCEDFIKALINTKKATWSEIRPILENEYGVSQPAFLPDDLAKEFLDNLKKWGQEQK